MSGHDAGAVHARVSAIQDRLWRHDHEQALTEAVGFLTEFRDAGSDGWLSERIGFVMLLEGLALDGLGRVDEAVTALDELRSRFGDSADPDLRDHAVRGMMNRARILKAVDRREEARATYDDAIRTYGDDTDPRIRRRVSWSIWLIAETLEDPVHEDERVALYVQLADRHDEGVDATLDSHIAYAIRFLAWVHARAGEQREVIATCDEIVDRFAASTALRIRERVVDALLMKPEALQKLGEIEAAVAVCDEIVARYPDPSESSIREAVAAAWERKGNIRASVKRYPEAIHAYDAALAVVGAVDSASLVARQTEILLNKGRILAAGEPSQQSEAVVIFDSAVAAYTSAGVSQRNAESRGNAVIALSDKVDRLCELGRSGEADIAGDQLVAALGDVVQPNDVVVPHPDPPDDDELARTVVEVLADDGSWAALDPPVVNAPADDFAQRALGLYRLTDAWTWTDDGAVAAHAAAEMLRDVADGYALLTGDWTAEEVAGLPLPQRSQTLRGAILHSLGVDEWLSEHGMAPIGRDGDDDLVSEAVEARYPDGEARDPEGLATSCLSALYRYDLRLTLCDSTVGREVARSNALRHCDCVDLASARAWIAWLGPEDELAPLAVIRLMVARGLFISSHSEPSSSADIAPSRQTLRDLLNEEDSPLGLLDADGGVLPGWLREPPTGSE